MLNCLLVCAGSAGDVYPFLGLGEALRGRGHRVTLLTYGIFEGLVRSRGLGFALLPGPAKGRDRLPDVATIRHGYGSSGQFLWARLLTRGGGRWRRLARASTVLPLLRPVFEGIASLHVPGSTVVIASSQTLGARVAHDALGVPLVHFHLSPMVFRSSYRPARQPPLVLPNWLPRWVNRTSYWLADALIFDPLLAGPLNALRRDLGLDPVSRPLQEWRHSPCLVLGLFPEWFAPPQPDWPSQTRLVGFPLHDAGAGGELPGPVKEFLEAGKAPVVITPSSEVRKSGAFFAEAVRACQALDQRALLITRFREQLPDKLPEGCCHADYLPFSEVLPRASLLLHHGGVGSAAQALAAGIPQLVVPLKNDQFDNAERLRALGVARVLSLRSCRAHPLADRLCELLTSEEVASRCREFAGRMTDRGALARACTAIEGVVLGRAAA
jgi:UDP:flavonoid glycosyltransferase YjiC (YdhE family)